MPANMYLRLTHSIEHSTKFQFTDASLFFLANIVVYASIDNFEDISISTLLSGSSKQPIWSGITIAAEITSIVNILYNAFLLIFELDKLTECKKNKHREDSKLIFTSYNIFNF